LKHRIIKLLILLFLIYPNINYSQEWKSLNIYQKETGNLTLEKGCWIKKDRKNQTEVWKYANEFKLNEENGDLKYTSISQKRDFYLWFDQQLKKEEMKLTGLVLPI